MSILHIRHIRASLEKHYRALIDVSDAKRLPPQDQENCFLTRALAAYGLGVLGNLDPKTAAASVTDGFGDNGIDLVYYELQSKILYVLQSKWSNDGSSTPAVGEIHKFISGIEDLVNASFDRFSNPIQLRKDELTAALDDPETRIVVAVVHTGQQNLSTDAQRELQDLLAKLNDTSDVVELRVLSQFELHESLAGQARGTAIDLEITLHEWGQTHEPLQAFYGQIEAALIHEWWQKHRDKLFVENIRNYRGSTEVNESIQKTLEQDPEHFFFLNNGLTALCTGVTKKLRSGTGRETGVFECSGFSIVNGAQTVGSIATAFGKDAEKAAKAKVLLRLISLENASEGFGREITIASNTQNRIERRDFVSLDPEQHRLRTDLWLEGKDYVYKSGDPAPEPSKGCTVNEATAALACACPDVRLAVQAKREIGLLWEDISKPPYKLIFNGSVSSHRLWRAVEILRLVEQTLYHERSLRAGRERLIAVHGNLFVLHKIFQGLPPVALDEIDFDFDSVKKCVPAKTTTILESLISQFNSSFSSSYPATLFKNLSKCRVLDGLTDASHVVS